jgi:hypothetical protein
VTRSNSTTDRSPMGDDVLKAREIYKSLEEDPSFTLKKAKDKYREVFGISPDHGNLDREYVALVRNHFGHFRPYTRPDAEIRIPVRLALAFFLRELHGRKRKTSLTLWLGKITQMDKAQALKTRYMNEQQLSAEEAEVKAAEELHRTFEWRGERRSLMTVPEMLEWFSHPGRYGWHGRRGGARPGTRQARR